MTATVTKLFNNAVTVSGKQQRDSAVHIHVPTLPQTPSHPGCHIALSRALCAIGTQEFYKHVEHLSVQVGDSTKAIAPFWASVSFFLQGKQSYILPYHLWYSRSPLSLQKIHSQYLYQVFISIKTAVCLGLFWAWCVALPRCVCVYTHIRSVHIQHTHSRNTWVYTNEKLKGDYSLY